MQRDYRRVRSKRNRLQIQRHGRQSHGQGINIETEQIIGQNRGWNRRLTGDRRSIGPTWLPGVLQLLAIHLRQQIEDHKPEVHRSAGRIEDANLASRLQLRMRQRLSRRDKVF